jgi:hypothetical protein
MRRTRFFLWALIALGCSGRAIDVGPGSGSAGATASGAGGAGGASGATFGGTASVSTDGYSALPPSDCTLTTPLPMWPDSTSCLAASAATGISSLVGTWQGYVENASAPWDNVILTITGASVTGGVCGTLAVGAGPAPAPATDPNLGYPPDATPTSFGGATGFVSGAPLTLQMGTTDGTRVRFSVAPTEAWRSWCQLQSSFTDDQSCNCLPPFSSTMMAAAGAPSALDSCKVKTAASTLTLNCRKLFLCNDFNPLCVCNASSCDAENSETDDFDLRFTADMGEGSDTANAPARTIFTRENQ